jgi:DNA-directed RNA polymerase subunit RPC12/RpoP
MEIELVCHTCHARFTAAAETPQEEIIQRMTDEGPWYALAAGGCFRDMIHTALEHRGRIVCPECGALVRVRIVAVAEAIEFLALHN